MSIASVQHVDVIHEFLVDCVCIIGFENINLSNTFLQFIYCTVSCFIMIQNQVHNICSTVSVIFHGPRSSQDIIYVTINEFESGTG